MASSIAIHADASAYSRVEDKKMLDNDDEFPRDFVKGAWAAELNDWGAHCIPNGWMVCCCPWISIAQISVRIGVDSYSAALAKQLTYNAILLALIVVGVVYSIRIRRSVADHEVTIGPSIAVLAVSGSMIVLSSFWVRSLTTLRTRVRERFGIAGSPSDDRDEVWCCTACAIAQMATQVKSYTPGSCDFRAPDMLPAYLP